MREEQYQKAQQTAQEAVAAKEAAERDSKSFATQNDEGVRALRGRNDELNRNLDMLYKANEEIEQLKVPLQPGAE